MTIDMEQFKATYIEESLEGLDIMESHLLELLPESDDAESVNTIFRAAHSIKGGAATFGFADIAEFTHIIETLLDEVRDKKRQITREAIDLFLASVDCLRGLMGANQPDESELERVDDLKQALTRMLDDNISTRSDASMNVNGELESGSWEITFCPHTNMLRSGNDVVRMFRELEEHGELEVTADTSNIPDYEQMDPESLYLSWKLLLKGNVRKSVIDDVFLWVEDECDLEVVRFDHLTTKKFDKTAPVANVNPNAAREETETQASSRTEKSQRTENKVVAKTRGAESSSIRVGIEKVDDLINMVGELVITQSMLSQLGKAEIDEFDINRIEKMREGLAQLERNTRELQESVMRIRMLPISFAFNRFPRMVHDMCRKLDKKIELKIFGEGTELDKTVMEKIGDPLVHIVRNSCDHGIEAPQKRLQAGKSETGTVILNAFHQGGDIVIEIKDDGAGLKRDRILNKALANGLISEGDNLSDEQVYDLLFQPGFSTAAEVTDVSGRGVGMDVVKKNVQALGGRVEVVSVEGEGSTFTIRLPLTLAILDGQLIRVGEDCFIVPLVSIIESMQLKSGMVSRLAGKAELYRLRNEYLPVIRLYETFDIESGSTELTDGLVVVVESGDGRKAGLFVDDLLSQQQVVIKSLETNFKSVQGISGATILGDGTVALILDVASLIRLAYRKIGAQDLRKVANQKKAA